MILVYELSVLITLKRVIYLSDIITHDAKIYKRFFAIFVFLQIFVILFRVSFICIDAFYGQHDIGFYNTCANYDVPYYAINYDNGFEDYLWAYIFRYSDCSYI